MDETIKPGPVKNVIGGRHGSPSVTVALPFSKVANVDSELRGFVEELAGIVAQLATATTDAERRTVGTAAQNLIERLAPPD
ncbi:MAG: hypothetical protein JJE46_06825 [Acidimicrobiia bacterium]|nr:hypothetical protein [Acidimicrobiia bacterium]